MVCQLKCPIELEFQIHGGLFFNITISQVLHRIIFTLKNFILGAGIVDQWVKLPFVMLAFVIEEQN